VIEFTLTILARRFLVCLHEPLRPIHSEMTGVWFQTFTGFKCSRSFILHRC